MSCHHEKISSWKIQSEMQMKVVVPRHIQQPMQSFIHINEPVCR